MVAVRMKAVILLVASLCPGGAQALWCHNCTNTAGSTCSGPIQCPSSAQACLSEMISATGTELPGGTYSIATKSCAQSCDTLTPVRARASIKEVQASLHCCSTDLCNGARNWGPAATTLGLLLVATVLVTLPAAFL